jgi:hypothetical protein
MFSCSLLTKVKTQEQSGLSGFYLESESGEKVVHFIFDTSKFVSIDTLKIFSFDDISSYETDKAYYGNNLYLELDNKASANMLRYKKNSTIAAIVDDSIVFEFVPFGQITGGKIKIRDLNNRQIDRFLKKMQSVSE